MPAQKRHIVKAISWRLIGTLDTFLVALIISSDISIGAALSLIDLIVKFLAYYIHERLWFSSKIISASKRHVLKTISWRLIASIFTLIIAYLVSGNATVGIQISTSETISKLLLYYFHEKVWYRINFGLKKRNTTYEK